MNEITVSIVEDLTEVRESLENLIRESSQFLFVSAYSNAETAQKNILLEQPQIVIMDINLPGMSGIDCIRKIKTGCPDTQFMMYTIFEDDDKVFEALEAGASGYLRGRETRGSDQADFRGGPMPATSEPFARREDRRGFP